MLPASQDESTEARLRAAVALHQQGALEAAAQAYRRVLELSPQHADALHLLGVTEQQRGRPEAAISLITEAIAAFTRALELRPGLVDAQFRLGDAQRALNRHAQALASYERVLAVQPGH